MHRRRFLAAAAVTAGAAGCLGGTSQGTPEPTSKQTPDPTPESPPTQTTTEMGETVDGLTVSQPRVFRSVVTPYVKSHNHLNVAAPRDAQFLVVDVLLEGGWGETDPMEAVLLDLGGERAAPTVTVGGYGPRDGHVELAFEVAVGEYDAATVGYEGRRWRVPDAPLEALAASPRFEVRAFTVPDSVERHDAIPVSFSVANTGERDGRFLAEFGAAVTSDLDEMTLDIAAGEETTHEELVSPGYWEGYDAMPVVLDWGRDRIRKEVPVSDE